MKERNDKICNKRTHQYCVDLYYIYVCERLNFFLVKVAFRFSNERVRNISVKYRTYCAKIYMVVMNTILPA